MAGLRRVPVLLSGAFAFGVFLCGCSSSSNTATSSTPGQSKPVQANEARLSHDELVTQANQLCGEEADRQDQAASALLGTAKPATLTPSDAQAAKTQLDRIADEYLAKLRALQPSADDQPGFDEMLAYVSSSWHTDLAALTGGPTTTSPADSMDVRARIHTNGYNDACGGVAKFSSVGPGPG